MATARELIQSVQQSPFMQKMTPEHLIHLFEGGSALHGARHCLGLICTGRFEAMQKGSPAHHRRVTIN